MTPEKAKKAYRDAWLRWARCNDPFTRGTLGDRMDELQPFIAPGPGPVWDAFKKTLPGYDEYWRGLKKEAMVKITLALGAEK